ncbi:MAG: restriction endonuclease subunit S [Bacteroidales bacterium]
MGAIYKTILVNQICEEQRWDVPFNVELMNLYKNQAQVVTIEEISSHLTNGATPLGAQFLEEGVHFYRANDIKRYNLDYFNHKHITKEQSQTLKRSILKSGDIIFTIKGKIGDVAVFPENQEESNINQDNALIRLKKGYDPFYFCGIFNSKFGLNQVKAFATETINPFLGIGNLKKLRLPILDKQKQKAISDKVKKTIGLELKSLSVLEQAQNLFYQKLGIDFSRIQKEKSFSVKLSDFEEDDLWTPSFSYPLYVNTLKAIQQKWQTVPLGEIATIKKGDEVGSDNYNKYLDKKDSDVPFIRTSDLVNYEADQFPDFYIPEEIYKELGQDLKAGDVLFTKDGKIGMSGIITKSDRVIISSGIARLRLKAEAKKFNLTPEYLFILLSLKETGLYSAIRRTVIASTIPHLREERLKEFKIPVLDKTSIEEITKLVKEAFELKDEKKKLIKEVREEIDSYFDI